MTDWTDDQFSHLQRGIEEKKTAAQIADELGITRGAVMGKISRHGLRLVLAHGQRPENAMPRRRPKRNHSAPITEFIPKPTEAIELPADESLFACTIMDLTDDTCRFPMGTPSEPEFRYCGDAAMPDRAYCPRHSRLCYRPYFR